MTIDVELTRSVDGPEILAALAAGGRAVTGQCAFANCSLSVEPCSATVDASGVMAEVTRSK